MYYSTWMLHEIWPAHQTTCLLFGKCVTEKKLMNFSIFLCSLDYKASAVKPLDFVYVRTESKSDISGCFSRLFFCTPIVLNCLTSRVFLVNLSQLELSIPAVLVDEGTWWSGDNYRYCCILIKGCPLTPVPLTCPPDQSVIALQTSADNCSMHGRHPLLSSYIRAR